jgi:hypothetical protein
VTDEQGQEPGRQEEEPTQLDGTAPGSTPADKPDDESTMIGPDPWPDAWPAGPAATAEQPPVVDDRGPSGTSILPTVPAEPAGAEQPAAPRWSARAHVPTPGPDQAIAEEEWSPGEPPRSMILPVALTTVVVVLLAIIAFGIWLILRNSNSGAPAPSPSTHTTSAPPTTRVPTRTSAPPTTTAAVPVALPPVSGLTYDQAAKRLQDLGFVPQRSNEPNSDVPAGRVIGTDPPEGTVIRPGFTITVRVSTGAPTKPPAKTPTPTSTH